MKFFTCCNDVEAVVQPVAQNVHLTESIDGVYVCMNNVADMLSKLKSQVVASEWAIELVKCRNVDAQKGVSDLLGARAEIDAVMQTAEVVDVDTTMNNWTALERANTVVDEVLARMARTKEADVIVRMLGETLLQTRQQMTASREMLTNVKAQIFIESWSEEADVTELNACVNELDQFYMRLLDDHAELLQLYISMSTGKK